jgi:hypothetical protein
VTTVSPIIAVLTDEVLELKIFETLVGSIEKIETLGVELKIATNFGGVNNNFPKRIRITRNSQLQNLCINTSLHKTSDSLDFYRNSPF